MIRPDVHHSSITHTHYSSFITTTFIIYSESGHLNYIRSIR